jgi:hypothetical protein
MIQQRHNPRGLYAAAQRDRTSHRVYRYATMAPWTSRIHRTSPVPYFLPLQVRVLSARWKQRALFLDYRAIGITDPGIPLALGPGDCLQHLASVKLIGEHLDQFLPVCADPAHLRIRRTVPNRSRLIMSE